MVLIMEEIFTRKRRGGVLAEGRKYWQVELPRCGRTCRNGDGGVR